MQLFSPPPSDKQKPATVTTTAAIAISLVISLLLAGGFVAFASTSSFVVAPLIVTVVLAMVFGLMKYSRQQALAESYTADEKPKRFAPGQDMYTMIDRMLDDLDEDELAYLRRRLEEQELVSEDDLVQSMGELLSKRAELRGKG